ncbi:selA, partial [Symbiodinium sp. CCMP2456]
MVDSSAFKLSWPKFEMPKFSWKGDTAPATGESALTPEGNPISRALDKVSESSKNAATNVRNAWGAAVDKLPFGGKGNAQVAQKEEKPGFFTRLFSPAEEPRGSETMSEFIAQDGGLQPVDTVDRSPAGLTIDRVNRSTAVVQLRGAIHSLGAEIARRTEGLPSLGAGELLDRLIRQLEFPRPTSSASCVNATGAYFLAPTLRPPIAAAAIQAARVAADGFRQGPFQSAAPIAAKLVGAERGKVLNSRPQAIASAIEALAAGGVCVVARGDMTELAPGVRIDAVARRAGATLREVGAADAASASDFQAALEGVGSPDGGAACVLLRQSILGSPDTDLLAQV